MVDEANNTNNTPTSHNLCATTTSYSSIGAIPKLIRNRSNNSAASVNGLIRVFSHPSSKFKGSVSVLENLGTYHQQFVNVCKTSNST